MYMLWIILTLGVATGTYALFESESMQMAQASSPTVLANNMSEYRQAVAAFAKVNPLFHGSVPLSDLKPYLGSIVPDPIWQNVVVPNVGYAGSLVVIYSTSPAAQSVIPVMEQLALGSALAGASMDGELMSPGNPPVPLPPPVAQMIPNGMPVWMTQSYE
ncbi:type IV pilus biogenesis protein PilM [Paraburkholderia sp. NMBU_R16]|uniref:type IV pilus biogenesis protein PilM n=1 Tax=Paraburkholderia sp. NMBU_R16 TaxID=2698676 RepID=UPI001565E7E8|nr:type IV pilus biogenesis protein PilM [Paraburkholderia sp. NMBU_R16]NRO98856.1 type IV pilus biogenesis protein PilM [Paraburkholderia sp. NMBU_R16]